MRRLHPVAFGAVIFGFHDLSDHSARRDVEDTVEMQSACFTAALPYADMLPAVAGDEVFECVTERLTKTLFGMQRVRERKRAKEIPISLQIYLLDKRTFRRMAFVFLRSLFRSTYSFRCSLSGMASSIAFRI